MKRLKYEKFKEIKIVSFNCNFFFKMHYRIETTAVKLFAWHNLWQAYAKGKPQTGKLSEKVA